MKLFLGTFSCGIFNCVISSALLCYSTSLYARSVTTDNQVSPSSEIQDCPQPLESGLIDSGVIKKININLKPIFDTSQPDENNWLFRTANALHIGTRPSVIDRDLLFTTGEPNNPRLIKETERRLRNRPYVNAAQIISTLDCNGDSQVDVNVKEVWTFEPSIHLSRTGANTSFGYGIKDANFLGLGKSLDLSRSSDETRSNTNLQYLDPNTGFANTELELNYGSNSDGFDHSIRFEKPFASLQSTWTGGINLEQLEQADRLYDAGEEVEQYLANRRLFEIFIGKRFFQTTEHSAHRLLFGTSSEDASYNALATTNNFNTIPDATEYIYPWLEYQYLSEKFIEAKNIQQINRVEDLNLGINFSIRLGYSSSEIPELNENIIFSTALSKTLVLSDNQFLIADTSASGFLNGSDMHNTFLNGDLSYHWKNFDAGQFYVHARDSRVINPFGNNYLPIGGDTGLRGFPSNYQVGDHLQLFNIEQRVYGSNEVLSLFYLGGAVFFDGGQVWGESPTPQTESGWLRDVGFGLRLSNTRLGGKPDGGQSVVHLDVAFPLDPDREVDPVQFLVKVKSSF